MGLLQLQDQRSDLLIGAELEQRLRFLLRSDDPFVSGTAAAALGELMFRTEVQGDIEELERGLPQVLVRAVGGIEFYPQYARFAPLAERSLRRITGVHLQDEAGSAWVDWLAANHEGFHVVRGRIEGGDDERSHLRVAWTAADGRKRVLVGSDAVRMTGDRVVGEVGSARLLQLVSEPGLLDASMMPGIMGLAEAPLSLGLDISVDLRRKTLSFHGSAGEPWVGKLGADLDALYETTGWQALAGSDAAGRDFLAANLVRFDTDDFPSEDARAAALIALSSGRIAGLQEDVLRSWVAELQGMDRREAFWTPELSREFLGLIPLYAQDREFAGSLLALVMSDRSHSIDTEALELLAGFEEPSRSDLVLQALKASGPERCADLLGDERLAMRLGAVRALATFGKLGTSHLITALDDVHPLIQATAIRGLGQQRAAIARDVIAPFSRVGMPIELRREAVVALGHIGSPASLPDLVPVCAGEEVSLQLAAVNAVAEIPGPEADNALGGLFVDFAGMPMEGSYMRALMSRGSGTARAILRPHLVSNDPRLSQRAALLAGSLGDPVAAPVLVDWLPRDPRNPELLAALANALCVDFRNTPDPAGTYQAWWMDNSSKKSSDWLRQAAGDSGFDLPRGFDDPTRVAPTETVSILLDILETGPAQMRAATCYFLFSLTGVDAAVIAIGTPRSELLRRAQPWHQWLDSQGS
jgi:HEAT repeat protein